MRIVSFAECVIGLCFRSAARTLFSPSLFSVLKMSILKAVTQVKEVALFLSVVNEFLNPPLSYK
jgi:flagellar biosynthesis protein FliQ